MKDYKWVWIVLGCLASWSIILIWIIGVISVHVS